MNHYITHIYKQLNFNNNFEYSLNKVKYDNNILNNLIYMDKKVIQYIHKYIHHRHILNYNNINITINSKTENITKKFINNILNIITNLQNLMQNYKSLNIIFYLTELKKQFPRNRKTILGPYHVNSGLTIHGNPKNTIIIFRKEELYKVLIHELMHDFGCDMKLFNPMYNKIITNKYNIENSNFINVNESYVELITELIYLTYIAKKGNKKIGSVKKMYNDELKYSITKCKQILNHNGVQKLDGHISFRQNSNVLSYYIFKTALLYNIDESINFLENIHNYTIKNEDECYNYCKLVINSVDNLFNSNIMNKYVKKDYINNSLRMIKSDL